MHAVSIFFLSVIFFFIQMRKNACTEAFSYLLFF